MATYSVVEFVDENSVEIIPSSWISPNKKTALWPKDVTPSMLKIHLKCRSDPKPDWTRIDIRILAQTGIVSNIFVQIHSTALMK